MSSTPITKETYLEWYKSMLLMRKFEEKAGQLYGQQKIRGFCHLYIGQEAVVAGTMSVIKPEDSLITAYRDHAHALAKGVSANACMAELYGKITVVQKVREVLCTSSPKNTNSWVAMVLLVVRFL
jgi:pyruvate dehydrogenase E1 component alpha subunit